MPELSVHDEARTAKMAEMYRNGCTLQAIGKTYGITRERVRQVLTKRHGFHREDGGQRVQTERKLAERTARLDAAALRKWGCTRAQYIWLRDQKRPTRAWAMQRRNARDRGIGWKLKLWQWWEIWEASGHWQGRGRGGEGYCMCRIGDRGPYAVGNVYIATNTQNIADYHRQRSRKTAA